MDFVFSPVVVSRGRKFRGHAYYLGYTHSSKVAWNVTVYSAKLWDPLTRQTAWANPEFLEDETLPPEKIERDRASYVESELQYVRAHCGIDHGGALRKDEIQRARTYALRIHPEFGDAIDAAFPDQRDVAEEIEKTFQWAVNLKSRPAVIYGRACPGGKPYGNAKKVRIAYTALVNRGLAKLPDFAEVFEFYADTMHMKLPKDVRSEIDRLKRPEQANPENSAT